jgi:DNA invertase Pin-like site-specific DNA recombinase
MLLHHAPIIVIEGVSAMKAKRAAIYLRVSRDSQTVENQRIDLTKLCELRKWDVVAEYADEGISGATGREKRPGLDNLLKDATRRRFDIAVFWAVDRLGRSTATVTAAMDALSDCGVNMYAFKESMDTSTAHGRAMLEMAAVFGRLEREMIKERVIAGIARVKEVSARTGKIATKSGRAIGRPKLGSEANEVDRENARKNVAKIKAMRAAGDGYQKIARELNMGVGTVMRIVSGVERRRPGAGLGRGRRAA